MFKLLQSNQVIWVQAATVAAAVIAILFSALAISPEIDHRVLPTQSTVVSAVHVGVGDDGFTQLAIETNCHIGQSCAVAIMPGDETAVARFDGSRELSRLADYRPSGVAYLLFHPPRAVSQV